MENKSSNKILSWAEEDRPREKMLQKGAKSLTNSELLAILIGSGTPQVSAVDLCREILNSIDNDLDKLAKLTIKDLMKFKGIGEAKAITIVAALEIGRRKLNTPTEKTKITASNDIYNFIYSELIDLTHEEFWVVLLNRANVVLEKKKISSGGFAGTVADPKIIFKIALENSASAIILIHNHPSGNTQPSQEDIKLTNKLREVGLNLDLPILDHIIFTNNSYLSFADQGLI